MCVWINFPSLAFSFSSLNLAARMFDWWCHPGFLVQTLQLSGWERGGDGGTWWTKRYQNWTRRWGVFQFFFGGAIPWHNLDTSLVILSSGWKKSDAQHDQDWLVETCLIDVKSSWCFRTSGVQRDVTQQLHATSICLFSWKTGAFRRFVLHVSMSSSKEIGKRTMPSVKDAKDLHYILPGRIKFNGQLACIRFQDHHRWAMMELDGKHIHGFYLCRLCCFQNAGIKLGCFLNLASWKQKKVKHFKWWCFLSGKLQVGSGMSYI